MKDRHDGAAREILPILLQAEDEEHQVELLAKSLRHVFEAGKAEGARTPRR